MSIVVSNYNGKELVDTCLQSIFRWTDGVTFEVIVVDADSKDGSVEFVRDRFRLPNLRVLASHHRIGLAESLDLGMRSATGKYVVFLDNDTLVQPGWLAPLVSVAESVPDLGAAQPLLVSLRSGRVDTLGGVIDHFGDAVGLGSGHPADKVIARSVIFFPRGAAFFARRDALVKVGGFDCDFYLGYEEIDPAWRLWLGGYQILSIPDSRVLHAIGQSSSRRPIALSQFHGKKNQIAMLIKNYEVANLLRYLPMQVLLLGIFESVLSVIVMNPAPIEAYFRALWWNLSALKKTMRKRAIVQEKIRKKSDSDLEAKVMISFGQYWNLRFRNGLKDSLLWKAV